MSVSSVSSSSSLDQTLLTWQVRSQKIQNEFQQIGQDLQAGNLSQAQSDFSVLNQNLSGSSQGSSTLSQAFSSLGSALQSGNLAAAQKAYSAVQQDVQQAGLGQSHHHSGSSSQSTTTASGSTFSQLLSSLGSALQTGSLSAAQTAYSTLAQDFSGLSSLGGAASVASAVSLCA